MESEPQQVVVVANQGTVDATMAALRYVAFLVTAVTAVLGFLSKHDVAGLAAYIQANGGQISASVAALIALGISAYGVLKTKFRGKQVASVAANPRVPESVATIKE